MPRNSDVTRNRRPRPGIAVAVLGLAGGLLTVLGGCSPGPGTDLAAPAGPSASAGHAAWPDAIPRTGLTKGMVLPLEAYMETYPESVAIERAVQRLETQCMARYGFTYRPTPPGAFPPPNNDDSNMARRYGIADPAHAAKYGYTIGDENDVPDSGPRLSTAEISVLTGRVALRPNAAKAPSTYRGKSIPADGCQGESVTRVGAAVDTGLPGRLDYESLTKSQADPRVQKVIGAWSDCMKSKGYTVDSPLNAADLAPHSSGEAGSAEITVATADVNCKQKTDLVKVWFSVESAIQRRQVEQNHLALQDVRDRITAAVKASAAVTG